jgi:hypothetical protein
MANSKLQYLSQTGDCKWIATAQTEIGFKWSRRKLFLGVAEGLRNRSPIFCVLSLGKGTVMVLDLFVDLIGIHVG